MTTHVELVRVGRLKVPGLIRVAAKHNLREIAAEIGGYGDIDAARVHLNQVLRGEATSAGVAAAAAELMQQVKKTIRKDALLAIEIVISLRPGSRVNQRAFFADSLAWVDEYFKVPVVSAVVHLDETAPHLHALLVPLVDGCLRGSDLVSSRYKLIALKENFHEVVGNSYGLVYVKPHNKSKVKPIGFEVKSIGFEAGENQSLCSVGFGQNPPLTKRQRMDLLTYQFTVGIQQKLARGAHRWSH